MNKRTVNNSLLAISGLATITIAARCDAGRDRPNVIFICVDDMNGYGITDIYAPVKTPNLDRLREKSVNFTASSCPSPVSVPSRAAFFSGLYPHNTGAYINDGDPWRKSAVLREAEAIPECFKRNGFYTWGRGKIFHAQLEEGRLDSMFDNSPVYQGGFGPFPSEENWLGGTRFYAIQPWTEPDTVHPDVKNTDAAVAFLEQEHDKPFFLYLGLWRPHCPYNAPERFFSMYNPEEITLPEGYLEDDLDDVPFTGRQLVDSLRKFVREGWEFEELWMKFILAYCANYSFADWNVGRVMDALENSKFKDNTIVVFCSDNGYQCGEKFRWEKGTLWEASAYSPMMIKVPGLKSGICQAPVSLIDIYPTLVDYCRLEEPKQTLDGRSLMPLLKKPSHSQGNISLTTYGVEYSSVRDERYRYIRYPDGTWELYDLHADRYEHNNLAGTPGCEEIISRLSAFIPADWAQSTGGRYEVPRH
jgi:arylsulfatase A-like enzyme